VAGPILGAVADDVTGASDLCSTLTREGMRTVQTFGVPHEGLDLDGFDAVVAGLKTRTAPVGEAVAESLEALARLRALGARHAFFKVCSTFDSTPEGNIGPVADALLDAVGGDLALVCPAFPANGRTVYQGHLFVRDALLSESSMAHHPLTPMTDGNLVRWLGRQTPRRVGLLSYPAVAAGEEAIARGLDELRATGATYVVADAREDAHLRALGPAAAELPLVVGGSGLALGLPAAYRAQGLLETEGPAAVEPLRDGPALVVSGSCSQATNEQVRRFAATRPAIRVGPDDDPAAIAAAAASHLAEGPVLVYTTAEPAEVARVQERLGRERASEVLEGLLADVARRLVDGGVRRLVVAGGETSGAVLSALGTRALAVGREIAPGVPWLSALDGPPLALVLKSGNFGGPDFFLEALA
jgi:uncharacterized protein YgbK (DUF1537 family)